MDHAGLMADWQSGNADAGGSLIKEIHRELEAIAAAKLSQERNSSLSTGDLINEAVIRLSKLNRIKFQDRAHILALSARIMRQILIDEARRRNADKHYHTKVTLQTNIAEWQMPIELLALDMHLSELRDIDPQRADIVEMRFFGGMSMTDISTVLDVSVATVKRRWNASRIWLQDRMAN
ncbi:ECF-type sigma factor [Parasphingorhabdus sp.]|uniref:ECF-type sigma factor n=1 Tax=Parasphingorhabdus sp. TaxID=2709688 RepID=UPI003A90BFF4